MRSHKLITTAALVITLVVAAPAAARNAAPMRPMIHPNPDEQVLATQTTSPASAQLATRAVQPNPDDQAATSTTASTIPHSEVIDNGGYSSLSNPPAVVRVTTPKRGFDWGDAGIGAAVGLGISMLAVACALGLSQRRARRAKGSAAVAS